MLSQLDAPPLERGITWSTVRFEREPQYWHVQPSRAKTARRVILRRCVSRGTFTNVTSRMTIGRASDVVSECSSHDACSMTSAFSFRSRTTARRIGARPAHVRAVGAQARHGLPYRGGSEAVVAVHEEAVVPDRGAQRTR